ncbi:hypothetical protein WN55_06737 [Dufourea novaeangliae]|uniref:Uncharacterized protein n=1 Tax=Dufourea novaeangliae TaxID=178035 RepID=A0A154P115_DUFNO|nr:hypothetical protein WN55_06737 [Dufourea novaeangliae]
MVGHRTWGMSRVERLYGVGYGVSGNDISYERVKEEQTRFHLSFLFAWLRSTPYVHGRGVFLSLSEKGLKAMYS